MIVEICFISFCNCIYNLLQRWWVTDSLCKLVLMLWVLIGSQWLWMIFFSVWNFKMGAEEDMNQRILSSVIDKTCTNLLRQILHHSVPQTEMPLVLNEVNRKEKLFKILNNPQKDILYPQNGYFNGSYSELDLPLLYILIRNASKITEHQHGWGKTPSPVSYTHLTLPTICSV